MKRKTCIFKNFVMLFMAIGLFTVFIGCDDKNDEVGPLRQEVQALRADLTKEFDSKVAAKTTELQKQLDETKAKVDQLSTKKGVTADELNAAKQEVINATVTKVAFDDYVKSVKSKIDNAATASDLNALKSDLGKVESRVSALETLVGSNKVALDNALDALDAKYKAQVDALQASINTNKSDLTDLLNKYKAAKGSYASLNERLAAIENKMGTSVVSGILNSRLTSLVLIPEYVADNGGALPVVLFAPLKTQNCGFISPDVEVKYAVSPSTVTASDIDVNNLKFMYNDPKTLKKAVTDDNLKAKFVSLTNGVLTVRVVGDLLNETWAVSSTNPEKRIDQLMLQVPLATGNAVVSSDWAKIQYKEESPSIVKHIDGTNDKYTVDYLVKPTVQEAKNLAITDFTVVDMAWDQQLDLNTVVKSVYSNWAPFNPSIYDLAFSFDLKDEKGNTIDYKAGPKNKTDQQEFININGSTASTRVYGKDANRAAIGRTPIVHVMLKSKDGCLVKEGFIKLNIVEKAIVAVPPVVYTKAYEAKCGTPQELYRVRTKTMNEDFYHKANMSKEEFHNNYKFTALALNPADPTNVGTIAQIKDPKDTDSYNIVYTLTEDEVWNNIGKTVWAEATYTYGTGPRASVIKVKFAVGITKETVNLDLLIGNYWYQDSSEKKSQTTGVYNTIIHNVAVPANKAKDPADATFENNINNAFVVVDKEKENILNLNNGVKPADKYKDYTYEYIFDVTANQPDSIKTVNGHKDGTINVSVSANGKNLIAKQGTKTETIATINPQSKTKGDELIYNENSELGKYLLNKGPEFMRARVVLVVKNSCGKRVNVEVANLQDKDRFYVNFLRPVNVKPVSGEYFVDAVDFGKPYTYIDMKKVAELSDWRKRVKGTDKYDFLPDNENYYDYYDVQNIKVTGKIKAKGLTIGGKDVEDLKKETNVDVIQTPNNEVFDGNTYRYGRLTYNNNGNNLGKNFTLVVPVTITYKWGQVEKIVEVEVRATSTSARKRVK